MMILMIFMRILRILRILMAMTSPSEEKATGGVNICRLLPTPSNQPPNMICAMIVMRMATGEDDEDDVGDLADYNVANGKHSGSKIYLRLKLQECPAAYMLSHSRRS